MRKIYALCLFLFLVCGISAHSLAAPRYFIENKGQIHNELGNQSLEALYYVATPTIDIFVRRTGLSYQFKRFENGQALRERIDVEWTGANPQSAIVASEPQSAFENHYIQGKRVIARTFQELVIQDVYQGVDVRLMITSDGIKYDFIVRKSGAESAIQMQVVGSKKIEIENGQLVIHGEFGEVRDDKPLCISESNEAIPAGFAINKNSVRFKLPKDLGSSFVIDPSVVWSSYYGGTALDEAKAICSDSFGNYYVAGNTNSTTFISFQGAQMNLSGTTDAYVAKFDTNNQLMWASYYGAAGNEFANDMVCDDNGSVYLVGSTSSITGFMTSGDQIAYGGGPRDGFAMQLFIDGSVAWCAYLGGSGDDQLVSIDWGYQGELVFLGETSSQGLAVIAPSQGTYGGGASDLYWGSIDPQGFLLRYSYYGGSGAELAGEVDAAPDFNYYFVGTTSSTGLGANGVQNTYGGGSYDGILVSMSAFAGVNWATYIGGTSEDRALGLDVTGDRVSVVGKTASVAGISTPGSSQTTAGGGSYDAFVGSYGTDGSLNWRTFYGGPGTELLYSVKTDVGGTLIVAGNSTSINLGDGGFQDFQAGMNDIVFAAYDVAGNRAWSTYLGGWNEDFVYDLFVGADQGIYFAGSSASEGIAQGLGYSQTLQGGTDAFFGRIKNCDYPYVTYHITGDTIFCRGTKPIICAGGADHYLWSTGDTIPTIEVDTTETVWLVGSMAPGCATLIDHLNFTMLQTPDITISADGPIETCGSNPVTLTAGGGVAYEWSTQETGESILATETGHYYVKGTGDNGCEAQSETIDIIVHPGPETVMALPSDSICVSAAPMNIIGLPFGGTFYGDGVVGNTIDPSVAGGGWHDVYYTFTDEFTCTNTSDTLSFYVMFEPTVLFVSQDTVYPGDPIVELTGIPTGGFYTGLGVSGNQFYPDLAGIGFHPVTYNYVDNYGCTNRATQVIYVCCVGVEETSPTEPFSYFPNPTEGSLQVVFAKTPASYRVLDVSGRLVDNGSMFDGQTQLDLSKLDNGNYFIHFQGNGQWAPAKVVVMR